MTVATSLIPGFDEIVRHGDPKRLAEVARRISELFLLGVANFRADHIELFDGVLIDLIRRRLFEVAKPGRQAAIKQAMSEISGVPEVIESRRDFAPAQRAILTLHGAGELNEAALLGFAKAHKYEEAIAALAAMSGVKIATLDRLIPGDRHDPMLIVGKTIG